MSRNTNVGADTGGRTGDVGGSTSGGKAGDVEFNAYGEEERTRPDVEEGDPNRQHGTPEDLKPGKRRTVGMDPDSGAGQPDVSGDPGSTSGGG